MKVYTKVGDKGTTRTYSGEEVPKDAPIVIIGGKIDSLLAALDTSLVVCDKETKEILEEIEKKLWQSAGEISLGKIDKNIKDPLQEEHITELEALIDKYNQKIDFFIRFTKEPSTRINEARVRCRDLETHLTKFFRENNIRPEVYRYINRLSDLLYVLACKAEKDQN